MSDNLLLSEFKPIFSFIHSDFISEGTFRLDSQYYALFENKIETLNASSFLELNDCCSELYEVPPFKHIYVKNGIPFYTSSDLFNIDFVPSHFLTIEMPNIEIYKIKKDQILMARSGNVESGILGQLLIAGDLLDGTTTSDHVLRFTINRNVINIGYLAAFLMSEFCKGQLLKNAAGAVIPAIRPDSLKNIKVPKILESLQEKIGNMMLDAVNKREQATLLTDKARNLVLQFNNLTSILSGEIETIDPLKEVEIRLVKTTEFTNDYRLDAHFYNPMADLVVKNIKAFTDCNKYLFELADCSFRGGRSIRNYVNKEHGTPFLSGKNIIQMRPDLKYISNSESGDISEMLLQKNWILITRSGTLGRVVFIWNNYENYTASEHLIRVVPFENEIDQGYLYAFLSSDYGYYQLLRYKHGSVIDEITEDQISKAIIPIPEEEEQKIIGDLVRQAYDLRAQAIGLEDEAQEILIKALTK
jgi:type I restriction enzyme S subunit